MDDLLNWLLQGTLIALATAAALQVMATQRAHARYRVVWLALILVVALPVIPFLLSVARPAAGAAPVDALNGPVIALPTAWWTSGLLVAATWALWIGVALGRVAWAAIAFRRVRRSCRRFPADVEAGLASWTTVRTQGRRARLMVSDEVASAAVLGYWRPVIAVAPSVVRHLAADDLDRIVIHEWAHVRRRDDLTQALQAALQIAAGWHPAVWWLDRRLRLEREIACDETVVDMTGSAKTYAACLTRLASLRLQQRSSVPALAALSASNLGPRIVRLLAPRRMGIRGVPAGAQVMLCSVAVLVGGFRLIGVETVRVARHVVDLAVLPASRLVHPAATIPAPRVTTTARAASPRSPAVRGGQVVTDAPQTSTTSIPNVAVALAEAPVASSDSPLAPLPATAHPWSMTSPLPSTPGQDGERPKTSRPWTTAADAGVAVGQSSQKAALATAGFFTRFGKKVAASF